MNSKFDCSLSFVHTRCLLNKLTKTFCALNGLSVIHLMLLLLYSLVFPVANYYAIASSSAQTLNAIPSSAPSASSSLEGPNIADEVLEQKCGRCLYVGPSKCQTWYSIIGPSLTLLSVISHKFPSEEISLGISQDMSFLLR